MKTAQNGPESISDMSKKYQPKIESDPTKGQKQSRKETHVALSLPRHIQSHRSGHEAQ
jgi:hypothetical protein